jgi:hypothetical protein
VSTFSDTPPGYLENNLFSIQATNSSGIFGPITLWSSVAMGFMLDKPGTAESVLLPLKFDIGNQVRVSLAESLNGGLGTILDSAVIMSSPGPITDVYSIDFGATPNLTAGQLYWLIASIEGSSAGSVGWANAYGFFSGLGRGPVAFGQRFSFNPSATNWNVIPRFEQAAFRI